MYDQNSLSGRLFPFVLSHYTGGGNTNKISFLQILHEDMLVWTLNKTTRSQKCCSSLTGLFQARFNLAASYCGFHSEPLEYVFDFCGSTASTFWSCLNRFQLSLKDSCVARFGTQVWLRRCSLSSTPRVFFKPYVQAFGTVPIFWIVVVFYCPRGPRLRGLFISYRSKILKTLNVKLMKSFNPRYNI